MHSIKADNSGSSTGDDSDSLLASHASAFFKCYVRQHCSVFADLHHEIQETKLPPKEEPKQGEEVKEEDQETQEKRERHVKSLAQLAIVGEPLFDSFSLLS